MHNYKYYSQPYLRAPRPPRHACRARRAAPAKKKALAKTPLLRNRWRTSTCVIDPFLSCLACDITILARIFRKIRAKNVISQARQDKKGAMRTAHRAFVQNRLPQVPAVQLPDQRCHLATTSHSKQCCNVLICTLFKKGRVVFFFVFFLFAFFEPPGP